MLAKEALEQLYKNIDELEKVDSGWPGSTWSDGYNEACRDIKWLTRNNLRDLEKKDD